MLSEKLVFIRFISFSWEVFKYIEFVKSFNCSLIKLINDLI